MPSDVQLYSVGHSTLTAEAFVQLLEQHGVAQVADVRLYPASRRHPHFAAEPLRARLAGHFIAYRHFPALGGRRRPSANSTNAGWKEPGFRGYADYMGTDAFEAAVLELLAWAAEASTAMMCAEARWWQCHRRLIADALVVRGVSVRHISGGGRAVPHELTPFARADGTWVCYPGLI